MGVVFFRFSGFGACAVDEAAPVGCSLGVCSLYGCGLLGAAWRVWLGWCCLGWLVCGLACARFVVVASWCRLRGECAAYLLFFCLSAGVMGAG